MIIAKQKREENIAEYILYMWQIEDLIRAYEFNRDKIHRDLVDKFDVTPSVRLEIRDWYDSLLEAMISERITQSGHLQFLVSLVEDLNDFHFRMVDSPYQNDYQMLYREAIYNIGDFRKRMTVREKISDIETCLSVLYGFLLMKIKNRPISDDTNEAIETIRKMVAMLAARYKDFEEGRLEI